FAGRAACVDWFLSACQLVLGGCYRKISGSKQIYRQKLLLVHSQSSNNGEALAGNHHYAARRFVRNRIPYAA
ncbi:MAG: hypothetical protein ACLP3R_00155, partial [Candidatus Korobacteraceae bacterium]